MNFLKRNWFGILINLIILFVLIITIIVFMAPKEDAKKRGFVRCTSDFVDASQECESKMCVVKEIMNHGWCNVKVIFTGLSDWVSGKQEKPWSNYMFNPQYLEDEEIDEEMKQFYNENPDLTAQMDAFRKNHDKLMKEPENDTVE